MRDIGVIPEQSIVYSSEAQGSDYARINIQINHNAMHM
jgi:hypothetical protein